MKKMGLLKQLLGRNGWEAYFFLGGGDLEVWVFWELWVFKVLFRDLSKRSPVPGGEWFSQEVPKDPLGKGVKWQYGGGFAE